MEQVFGSLLAHQTVSKFCDVIAGTEHETLLRDLCLRQRVNETDEKLDSTQANMGNVYYADFVFKNEESWTKRIFDIFRKYPKLGKVKSEKKGRATF